LAIGRVSHRWSFSMSESWVRQPGGKQNALSQPSRRKRDILPLSLQPRGLSRAQAAAYIGISSSKFDQLVSDGRMPRPVPIDGRVVWDRIRLDAAFDALPDENGHADDVWDRLAL
jgi:predicted DNA-binding transcriptional regulator AlpA